MRRSAANNFSASSIERGTTEIDQSLAATTSKRAGSVGSFRQLELFPWVTIDGESATTPALVGLQPVTGHSTVITTALSDSATSADVDFPLFLNDRWRVVFDDLQWILERRIGTSSWRGKSFCRSRDALLGCIHERAGLVVASALETIAGWPLWHHEWRAEGDR